MIDLKTLLIHTSLGHLLIQARNKYELLSGAFRGGESVGTLANDQLAFSLITRLCRSNMTFLDVGAHIGSVTAEVLYYDDSVDIVAIEAIPEKAAHLQKKFQSVLVNQCAVGDRDGEVPFFVHQKMSGYSSLNLLNTPDSQHITEIKVPITTLDNMLPSVSRIDTIKMDIEGAELHALRGGKDMIMRNRPTVMFESCANDSNHQSITDLWAFFSELNYTILLPNRLAHNGDGLSLENFLDSHVYPRRSTNYFAVPIERREEICLRARNVLGIQV